MKVTENFFSSKRTWSKLKDEILLSYLHPYLTKITHTRRPIKIADCFAGKGRFDDGEPGSPILIASAIKKARERFPGSNIQGVFIEKKYYKQLEKNIAPYSHFSKLLEGNYEDRVQNFIHLIDNPYLNLFLYVDPYGIKHLSFKHFKDISALNLKSFELLLNFNTFGFLREGCRVLSLKDFECYEDSEVYEDEQAENIERMNAIAHGDYWQTMLQQYNDDQISMSDAEKKFSARYVEKLKTIFNYVINIPIKHKRANIPKYRLIFGTNFDDGLLLMADKMSRTWKDFVIQDRGGQKVLFDELDFPDYIVSEGSNLDEVIWKLLSEPQNLKELFIKLFEIFGIAYSQADLRKHCKKMEENKSIIVQRIPDRTPTGRKAISYDYEKYNIILKRGKYVDKIFNRVD